MAFGGGSQNTASARDGLVDHVGVAMGSLHHLDPFAHVVGEPCGVARHQPEGFVGFQETGDDLGCRCCWWVR